jgi:hypothetical protein
MTIEPMPWAVQPTEGEPLANGLFAFKRLLGAQRQAAYWLEAAPAPDGFTIGIRLIDGLHTLVWEVTS